MKKNEKEKATLDLYINIDHGGFAGSNGPLVVERGEKSMGPRKIS